MKSKKSILLIGSLLFLGLSTIVLGLPSCDPPEPEPVISITIEKGIVVVDGTPIFPTGVYFWPDWSKGNGHHPLQDVTDTGSNMLVAYYEYIKPGTLPGGSQLNMQELVDGAAQYGVYFFVGQPRVEDIANLSDTELAALIGQTYQTGKASPWFLGFMIDEPPNAGYSPELTQRLITAINTMAADRLLWINFAPDTWSYHWDQATMQALGQQADIISGDLYPVPEGHCSDYLPAFENCVLEDPGVFADILSSLFQNQAIWFIQQANRWQEYTDTPPVDDRFPTLTETRYVSYDLLVHGVTGLFYFGISHWGDSIPYSEALYAEHLPTVTAEIQQMAPWFVSGAPLPVTTSDPKFKGHALTLNSQTLVIIVLESHKAESALIQIEGLNGGSIIDFFDGSSQGPYSNGFSVTFDDHEVRAFLIQNN